MRLERNFVSGVACLALAFVACGCATNPAVRPKDFAALADVEPSIAQEMRYFGAHNFIGRPIAGYRAAKCLLTRKAAEALRAVQEELKSYGMGLRVYDCYRPQRAVDDFVAWAGDLADTRMKKEFYPHVDKTMLFHDDYIAAKSGHSRGSTVDLTIDTLEMGTAFDYFDPLAHTASPAASPAARRNRLLLKTVMEKHGFRNLPAEWWHFTLIDEPYGATFFDFEVQ